MSTRKPDTTHPENRSYVKTGSRTWHSTRSPDGVATGGCRIPEIRGPGGSGPLQEALGVSSANCPLSLGRDAADNGSISPQGHP